MNSTESKHTPGPWYYGEDQGGRKRVYSGKHEIVRALSTHGSRHVSKRERDANARLIAAAPDLLAALKSALHFMNPMQEATSLMARDAIAKAEKASDPKGADSVPSLLKSSRVSE